MPRFLRKPIFWILVFALGLRLWGITYGLPFFLINDETPHVYGALKMIELKTLIPAFHQEEFKKVLYYPPLLSYFYLAALSPVIAGHYILSGAPPLSEYKAALALDPSFIWLAARLWMVLIGVADILVVYFLARRMFQSERAGLFAALFLALSFWHLQLSHNARHWLPAAFLLSLLWYMSLRIWEGTASRKLYSAAGLVAGMASGGVNTAAIVGIIPPLFMHAFREGGRRFWSRLMTREVLVLVGFFSATALLFFVLYPFGFTRAEGAPGPAADLAGRLAGLAQKNFADGLRFLAAYIRAFWNFETPLFLAALAGLGLFWTKGRRRWILAVISYALAFFSLLYLFDDFTSRGVIFILPILSVFAGYATDQVWEKLRNLEINKFSLFGPRFLVFLISIFFFLALFGWQFITDLRYDWLLSQDDTRLVATKWINGYLPAGSKIAVDSQHLRLTNIKEGIRELAVIDPLALRAADTALLSLSDERYPKPAYGVVNLHFLSPEVRAALSPDFFRKSGFKYLVVEYANANYIAADTRRLMSGAKLIQRFSQWKSPHDQAFDGSGKLGRLSLSELFKMKRFGLFVDIYEL